ncbi:pilus assembly PilX family protein [Pseudomonas citronellolis]|uniref:pilus assembly PilX family protein n=1 Tax=Pseudomonas citronellolis TaxID=53408 RepID=UPI0023E35C74|nr:PilX N-terminal domain-containing pilus assembly protein [Pseudomonas citronellolis]MDF3931615.1 PilX N-terminal domain-containing pilus assembly protein [Pseudomonas citronellolis]
MTPRHTARRQAGATLIIALVMLLLGTLIALSSIRGTTLETRIIGNLSEQQHARNAAESALREGERRLQAQGSLDIGAANCTTSVASHANLCILSVDKYANNADASSDWWGNDSTAIDYLGMDGSTQFDPVPRWNTAYIAFDPPDSHGNVEITDPDERSDGRGPHYYRVSAAAQADGKRLISVLQTVTIRRYY